MGEGHVRIRSWEEFKQIVFDKKPKSLVFILEQNGFSPHKELSNLKIIMPGERRYYMFFDFPKGDALRETGIPLHLDREGFPYLDEDEVKAFLEKQFERENLQVCSFWSA
jgi:hypothetical protein